MEITNWISAGGVVLDSVEQPYKVYVRLPTNNYGPWSFPKGQIDEGENVEVAALREVREETGITARILPGSYIGTGQGSMSVTHYFVMERVGPIEQHDEETQEVKLVTFDEAIELFRSSGNARDEMILNRARAFLGRTRADKLSPEIKLDELHVNLLGKIFFATLGAWLVGKAVNTKIRGTNEQVRVIGNALLASKRFQEELKRPGASVESVMQKLNIKSMSASEFERMFNIPWPL